MPMRLCQVFADPVTRVSKYRKRRKFGGTLVWWIEEIRQTLIRQLTIFVLFSIGYTVNSPIFLPPTCFERQFAKLKSRQTFVFYSTYLRMSAMLRFSSTIHKKSLLGSIGILWVQYTTQNNVPMHADWLLRNQMKTFAMLAVLKQVFKVACQWNNFLDFRILRWNECQ